MKNNTKTKTNFLQVKRNEGLEAGGHIRQQGKKSHKKRTIKDYENIVTEANQNQKIKTLIVFDKNNSNSIKYLALKKTAEVNVKMLTFTKLSLASFVYDVIDVFMHFLMNTYEVFLKKMT